MRTSKVMQDFTDSEALWKAIPLYGFIDDNVFLTTGGDLGVVWRIQGKEYETLGEQDQLERTVRFATALKDFGPEYRVLQYFHKRAGYDVPRTPTSNEVVNSAVAERAHVLSSCYTVTAYLVLLFHRHRIPQTSTATLKKWLLERLSEQLVGDDLRTRLRLSLDTMREHIRAFHESIQDFVPLVLLDRPEIFRFWREIVNLDPDIVDAVPLRHDSMLGYFVGDVSVEHHRTHLRIGDLYAKALSLKDFPVATRPNLVRHLIEIPSQFMVVSEFSRKENANVKKL